LSITSASPRIQDRLQFPGNKKTSIQKDSGVGRVLLVAGAGFVQDTAISILI